VLTRTTQIYTKNYTQKLLDFILAISFFATINKNFQQESSSMSYIPIIARVDSLPPLPESVMQIETLFAQGDPDIDKLVAIIEQDPSLTADVLAKVNAPYYGFSKSIVSVLQAVTLFGAPQIRSIVLASSIHRGFNIDLEPYEISTSEFSKICSMQRELMFQWYMGVDVELARKLTPIAFLMETGKILIAKDIVESQKTELFKEDLESYDDISYVENLHTMMTTAQIDALIFKHLNLHESFYLTTQYLDFEDEIPAQYKEMVYALHAIRLAINVKEQCTQNSTQEALEFIETQMQLPTQNFLRALARVEKKFNS
jgi:HD-like signal output (HDOD) protein